MEDLLSSNLQIKLSIKEGKSFDNILQPTLIVATLNSHSLETDLVQPNSNPQYLTDLIWEIEKRSLKKMRSNHTPLKVECYMLNEDENRIKIGYIILSIRCAQVIPKNKNVEVKMNWHTLFGLKSDLKACKPELLLSFTIEDQTNLVEVSKIHKDSDISPSVSSNQINIMPTLLEEEYLLQLGPVETCHDLFFLNITAGSVTNTDLLIKECIPNELNYNVTMKQFDCINDIAFWYHIMENDVKLKPFKIISPNSWTLNEKIVIKIRSSLKVLKSYFQSKPYLHIMLKYKKEVIAQAKLDIRSLVLMDECYKINESANIVLEQQCILIKNVDAFDVQEEKPCLNIKLKLQYVKPKNANEHVHRDNSLYNVLPKHCYSYNQCMKDYGIDCHRNPAGEFENCKTQNFFEFLSTEDEEIGPFCFSNTQNKLETGLLLENNYLNIIETYYCYCLHIFVTSIRLLASNLVAKNIEFRFHHPKSGVVSTFSFNMPNFFGEAIKLENIGCKLHFISLPSEIRHLLINFPPKLSIYESDTNAKVFIAQTVFDMTILSDQNKLESRDKVMLANEHGKEVGIADVVMNLENYGSYNKTKIRMSGENLGPPILDDGLAYKIVDELETWRERQQELFKYERKEELYLHLLSEEWQKRKQSLESKLACSMEQCKALANSLNSATEDLRIRRLKGLEKETRLIKINEDLQKQHEVKMREIREAAKKLKSDFTSKLTQLQEQTKLQQSQIEELKTQNECLQQTIKQQNKQLCAFEKCSLSQDQVASLLQEIKDLQEKLENAQKSKSFFKEQWSKTVREIHRMKTQHQYAVEMQIKNSKEEMQNMNLDEILHADSEALMNDQILVHQIQKEIDMMRPKSARFTKELTEQCFRSSRSLLPGESDKDDEKLKALIEERNSLLKTGSYTIDDEVIIKLNAKIRSLLISTE